MVTEGSTAPLSSAAMPQRAAAADAPAGAAAPGGLVAPAERHGLKHGAFDEATVDAIATALDAAARAVERS